jgi:hypothetical protein
VRMGNRHALAELHEHQNERNDTTHRLGPQYRQFDDVVYPGVGPQASCRECPRMATEAVQATTSSSVRRRLG